MEAYFEAWGRAANFWLIGTQQTLSATYTCEECRNFAKKQLNAAVKPEKCRAHVVACSNGAWLVKTSEPRHCCRQGSQTDVSDNKALASSSLPKPSKRRRTVAFPPDHASEDSAPASNSHSAAPSCSERGSTPDLQRSAPAAASDPSPGLPKPSGGEPAAKNLQNKAEAAATDHEIAQASPAPALVTKPRMSNTAGFIVTKPRISKSSAGKARSPAEEPGLHRGISAFLLSIDGAQDVQACSRAATLLMTAGVKGAGDLATFGFFDDSTRQLFVETLRCQGADEAALEALSYTFAKDTHDA